MSLGLLGAGYAAIGAVLAVGCAAMRRASVGDVILLLIVWPIALPLVLASRSDDAESGELVAALARASASPLASVLPDAETGRVLQSRVREAATRLVELDELLARPDFDPAAAERRAGELASRGAVAAATTAQLRVRTLGQLRALRERYRAELEEVRELIAQLVTQAELVRLQPSIAQASSELVRELVTRVEGLDDLFAIQANLDGAEYSTMAERSS
ncbi:MAG: hypothetical protein AB7T06_13730 [Kofleriaceae bacterium]